LEDKVEIGWSFTMPSELATLGSCVVLDHFDVEIEVIREGPGGRKSKNEKPLRSPGTRLSRFSDVVGSRKVFRVNARVVAQYNFACRSEHNLGKNF